MAGTIKTTFTPDEVKHWGLTPYAIYGGKVYSFKINEGDDKAYDINLLPEILRLAHNKANDKVAEINAKNERTNA